jgi:hypothetical protein
VFRSSAGGLAYASLSQAVFSQVPPVVVCAARWTSGKSRARPRCGVRRRLRRAARGGDVPPFVEPGFKLGLVLLIDEPFSLASATSQLANRAGSPPRCRGSVAQRTVGRRVLQICRHRSTINVASSSVSKTSRLRSSSRSLPLKLEALDGAVFPRRTRLDEPPTARPDESCSEYVVSHWPLNWRKSAKMFTVSFILAIVISIGLLIS